MSEVIKLHSYNLYFIFGCKEVRRCVRKERKKKNRKREKRKRGRR
jgi:hypothetical protein